MIHAIMQVFLPGVLSKMSIIIAGGPFYQSSGNTVWASRVQLRHVQQQNG